MRGGKQANLGAKDGLETWGDVIELFRIDSEVTELYCEVAFACLLGTQCRVCIPLALSFRVRPAGSFQVDSIASRDSSIEPESPAVWKSPTIIVVFLMQVLEVWRSLGRSHRDFCTPLNQCMPME